MGKGAKVGIGIGIIVAIIFGLAAIGSIMNSPEPSRISELNFNNTSSDIIIGILDENDNYNRFEGNALFTISIDGNNINEWKVSFNEDDFKQISGKTLLVISSKEDSFKISQYEIKPKEGKLNIVLTIEGKQLTAQTDVTLYPKEGLAKLVDLSSAEYKDGRILNANIEETFGVTGGSYDRITQVVNVIGSDGKYLDAVFYIKEETLEGVSCGDGLFGFLCKPFEYSTSDVLMVTALDHYWALSYYFENYDINVVILTLTTDILDEYGNKQEVALYTMAFTKATFEKINNENFIALIGSQGLEALANIADSVIIYT